MSSDFSLNLKASPIHDFDMTSTSGGPKILPHVLLTPAPLLITMIGTWELRAEKGSIYLQLDLQILKPNCRIPDIFLGGPILTGGPPEKGKVNRILVVGSLKILSQNVLLQFGMRLPSIFFSAFSSKRWNFLFSRITSKYSCLRRLIKPNIRTPNS